MTDKFTDEFNRLLKIYGLIVALLYVLDVDIAIRRELERASDIPFQMRPSVDVERTREKLQRHLDETKQDLHGMIRIIAERRGFDDG